MSSCPPIVLTFAGSDPTCGAGLQADLLTLSSLGCHPLSVVTALTVQDTRGVVDLHPVESTLVRAQANALLAEMRPAAFKLGVLGSVQNANTITEILMRHSGVPVVLDPVLASGRGDPLASEALLGTLRDRLIPLATVVTPNSMEARRLGGCQDLAECAQRMLALGARSVLITGTHEPGEEVVNSLFDRNGLLRADRWRRLPGSYHGSGCTLASAIAAGLAAGREISEAVGDAQDYTWRSLAAAFRPGEGQFLPDRFFRLRTSP